MPNDTIRALSGDKIPKVRLLCRTWTSLTSLQNIVIWAAEAAEGAFGSRNVTWKTRRHPIGSKTLTSFLQRRRRKLHYGDKNENVSDVFSTKRSSDTKEISFAIKKKTEPKYYYYEFKLLCVISTKSRIIHRKKTYCSICNCSSIPNCNCSVCSSRHRNALWRKAHKS